MNHAFMGGGIGEWFYEYALGLRFRHRRSAQALVQPSCSDVSTASRGRIALALRLSAVEECAYAQVVAASRSAATTPSLSYLRAAAKRALAGAQSTPVALSPEVALVLDDGILPTLISAKGHFDTVHGRVATEWLWESQETTPCPPCPRLAVSLSSPPIKTAFYLHGALLERFVGVGCYNATLRLKHQDTGFNEQYNIQRLLDSPKDLRIITNHLQLSWASSSEMLELGSDALVRWLRVMPRLHSSSTWGLFVE